MNQTSKRILAIGLPLVTVAASGAAVAFWTSGGTVTDSTASTAAGVSTLTVAKGAVPTNMAPGVDPGAVTATVTNPGSTEVRVSQVVAAITGVSASGCSATDYVLAGATMTTGATVLAPGASTTFSGATLGFANDAGRNQDACKGATVSLTFTAS